MNLASPKPLQPPPDATASTCPLFDLCRALPPAARRRVAAGAWVAAAGDPADGIYVVTRGCLKIEAPSAEGNRAWVDFRRVGEVYGLLGLFGTGPRETARATVASEVCVLPCGWLSKSAQTVSGGVEALLGIMAAQLSRSRDLVARRKLSSDARLARFLCELAEYEGTSGHYRPLRLEMSRIDIADHLDIAPETLSRSIGRLCALGVVSASARWIRILRPDALARLAGGQPPRTGRGEDSQS